MALGLTFAFDPSKGETPESVARKRALVAQIMGSQRAPRTIGEGLNALGDGIVANVMNRRADEAAALGENSANSAFDSIRSAITGGGTFPPAPGQSSASAAPMDYASQRVAQAFGYDTNSYRNAIASIESAGSGDYSAIGPTNPRLGRALGRYQIMEANIAPWSKMALGREVSPDEFLANPGIQDAIFDKVFGGYVNKFGPEGAAQAWFGGPGGVGKTNRQDSLGTNLGDYGKKFMAALGTSGPPQPAPQPAPVQVASIDPSAGMPEAVQPPMMPQPAPMPTQPQAQVTASPTGKGDRLRMANAAPVPMQPGPLASGDAQTDFIDRMTSPLPLTGGAPMPMQGAQIPSSAPTQVAQAAPPSAPQQDLSRIPVTAGGNAGVLQPGQRPQIPLDALLQAANNPWLTDTQRSVVQTLIKQQMDGDQNDFRQRASAAAQYGLDPNSEEGRNFILTGKLPEQRGGASELGLNPQYGVDEQGNPVLIQLSKNGKVVQSQMPEGIRLSKEPIKLDAGTHFVLLDPITRQPVGTVQKDLAEAETQKKIGEKRGELQVTLPTDMMGASQTVNQIDQLLASPGLNSIIGPLDQARPAWMLGAEGRDALARYNQLKGKAFLQAYTMLKGGGAITEIEGVKAENAMARMERSQDEASFVQALKDFRDAVQEGQRKLLQKAGIPEDRWGEYLGGAAPSGGDGWQDGGNGIKIRVKPQ